MIFRGIKSIFSDDYYYELVSKNIIGFIEKIQKYNRVLLTSLIKIIGETSKTSFSFNSEPLKEITGTKTTQLRWSANHAISNQIDEEPAFDFGGYMKFYANKESFNVLHRTNGVGADFKLLGLIFDVELRMHRGISTIAREASWRLQSVLRPLRFFSLRSKP